jgi:hypothetical protein
VGTGADQARVVTGTRLGRYGEVLLAFADHGLRLEVYNSYLLNECPQELWDGLSIDQIAEETGAVRVVLNGPRYWMMDGIGKVDNVEPLIREFGGISMRRAATIALDAPLDRAPYRDVSVNRGSIWFFDAGKPVYELVDPDGRTFVLQAFCTGVDKSLRVEDLAGLGERLDLPSGWEFRTRLLEDELRIDTTGRLATVVQDELENTYSLL